MNKYHWDAVKNHHEHGLWVPADVAQRLYDELEAIVDRADREGLVMPGISDAIEALAYADEEEL